MSKPFKMDMNNQDLNFSIGGKSRKDSDKPKILIDDGLEIIFKQMKSTGRRNRTIESYQYIFDDFVKETGVQYIHEIDADTLYNYIDLLKVSVSTKLIRLKSVKAVLSRFLDNGLIENKFWSNINIKIDDDVKEGSEEEDIELLINAIDKTTFVGFRDAIAIMLMYKTGIRINTLSRLQERHIDFASLELNLDGSIMKGRSFLKLPIDKQLANNIKYLIRENKKIKEHNNVNNDYIFITVHGKSINNTKSNVNVISKQLSKYAKTFDLKNINSHSLRRAYAKNLLKSGANTTLISKALGHKDLSTTTRYLHLDADEVSQSLREFL